jgi:mRNA interferase YafQ
MRTIERSSAFKRDYKRAKATPRHSKDVDSLLSAIVELLLSDQVLPRNNRDHALSGDWVGYRECHIKPDLLNLPQTRRRDTAMPRLGSHSELFG